MEEPVFGKEYIQEELQKISKKLSRQIEVFLIGGGAMSFHNLKDATKDIDTVVKNEKDFQTLQETLLDLDYQVIRDPNQEYQELGAQIILENTDNCRFDIFNQQVVNKLFFSKSMQKRCQDLIETRKLKVKIAVAEDIFLFKTVAGRTTDIEDMNTLIQTGLNFDTVKEEIQVQTELLGEELFITHINEALIDLEQQYNVTLDFTEYIEEKSEHVYEQLEILVKIDEKIDIEKLKDKVEIPEEKLVKRLQQLQSKDAIKRENNDIYKLKNRP